MALKHGRALRRLRVVEARGRVRAGRAKHGARAVEGDVEHLVLVVLDHRDALAAARVPEAHRAVDRRRHAQVARIVELRGRDLARVPAQHVHALPALHVPDARRVIERAGDDAVALRVEVQRHDLGRVPAERAHLDAGLHVPQLGRVVHRAGGDRVALRREGETHDLLRVPAQRVQLLASLGRPHLARLVERAGDDLVAVRIVEGDRVHDVLVALERQQLGAALRVPHLARAVVRAGDELVARLVEGAIGQRQNVRGQALEERKPLVVAALGLFNQLCGAGAVAMATTTTTTSAQTHACTHTGQREKARKSTQGGAHERMTTALASYMHEIRDLIMDEGTEKNENETRTVSEAAGKDKASREESRAEQRTETDQGDSKRTLEQSPELRLPTLGDQRLLPNDDGRERVEVGAANASAYADADASEGQNKKFKAQTGAIYNSEKIGRGIQGGRSRSKGRQRQTESSRFFGCALVTHSTERSSRSMSLLFISPLVSYSRMMPGG